MSFRGWPVEALEFFEGLEADNSKTYWQQNRDVYDRMVRASMEELLEELAPEWGEWRIFRPYRDIRFSADKSLYKTNIAAVVGDGYVQLTADGLGAGSGMYEMAPDQIDRYRKAVDRERWGSELAGLMAEARAAGLEVTGHDILKTAPRGYPRGHPRDIRPTDRPWPTPSARPTVRRDTGESGHTQRVRRDACRYPAARASVAAGSGDRARGRRRRLGARPRSGSGHHALGRTDRGRGLAKPDRRGRGTGERVRDHRGRLHARLWRPVHDQLRPRRGVHGRRVQHPLRGPGSRPSRPPERPAAPLDRDPVRLVHDDLDGRGPPPGARGVPTDPRGPPAGGVDHVGRSITVSAGHLLPSVRSELDRVPGHRGP